jgi:hypothetical protein
MDHKPKLLDPVRQTIRLKHCSMCTKRVYVDWIKRLSPSTISAIVFLYCEVLDREVGWLGEIPRAKHPKRLPVVFSRTEVRAMLAHVHGQHWLMAVGLCQAPTTATCGNSGVARNSPRWPWSRGSSWQSALAPHPLPFRSIGREPPQLHPSTAIWPYSPIDSSVVGRSSSTAPPPGRLTLDIDLQSGLIGIALSAGQA